MQDLIINKIFLDEDEFFRHQFDYDKDLIDHFQNSTILDQSNLTKIRTSQDKIMNNEGNMLIDTNQIINLYLMVDVVPIKI